MKKRTKAPAAPVPQDVDEADRLLSVIGGQDRELQNLSTGLDAALNEVKATFKQLSSPIDKDRKANAKALQSFAEANRERLLVGRAKTVRWPGGTIGWRKRPPYIKTSSGVTEKAVAETIKKMGGKFLKLLSFKYSLNKDVMRGKPDLIAEVEGVEIVDDDEDFFFEPFGAELNSTTELEEGGAGA